MRIAVLDLGTNTFNLLIVDSSGNDRPSKVFNEKLAPKIGQGGIISSLISDDAFERGLQCLEIQSKIIHSYKPDKTYVFGTSAIRNATNGSDFVREAKQRTGLDIHVIDGRREAELIYHGTRQAVDFGDQCVLILDIGGGSNEFILANRHRIFWKHSFEIGVSRLQQLLTPADPMSKHDVERIEQYVHGCIKPLYKAFDLFPASTLVGSSGAFDTFRDMIEASKNQTHTSASSYEIDIDDFRSLHRKLIHLPQSTLVKLKGMDPQRVDMIGIASVLVNFVTRTLMIHKITQSNYSLKEGVIYSMVHNEINT